MPDRRSPNRRSRPTRRRHAAQADNCTVGIDDEQFPAYDNGLRWNGWVCPTFRREVAEQVTAYFNQINAAGPWPEDQDYFVWVGDRIVHIHGAYIDEPDYTPVLIEPDADGRYAIGAMAWTWRRTDGQDHPRLVSRRRTHCRSRRAGPRRTSGMPTGA